MTISKDFRAMITGTILAIVILVTAILFESVVPNSLDYDNDDTHYEWEERIG